MNRIPALLCCVLLTAGVTCAQIADSPDGDALRTKKSAETITDGFPAPFPARGGTVDWGLALSGGGLRSAAFSIGAMMALYDLNLLDDIDVISSVSGGGYASYWLYSRYDGRDGTRFGDGAFSNTEFPVQVCTLANRSRFYPFIQMMAAGVTPRGAAFRSYRRAIQRSFGTDSTRERSLNALNRQITETRAPFFILNTTLKKLAKREGEVQSKIDKSFEIAPTYRGNYKLGFAAWPEGDISVKSWADGVAMSGAAVRFKLSRQIPAVTGTGELDLADGGLSENLAALPLIRRGVKNIIIVDAENDPGYKFESYCNLQSYLKSLHITLRVDSIDEFIDCKEKRHATRASVFTKVAVASGTAKSDDGATVDSNIYYIKMSRPASIFSSASMKDAGMDPESMEYGGKNRPTECRPGQLKSIDRTTMLRDVLSYADHLNSNWRWGKFVAFLPYINYNFPQIATIDQTFYSNQLDAFIGLGYLETIEMETQVARSPAFGN